MCFMGLVLMAQQDMPVTSTFRLSKDKPLKGEEVTLIFVWDIEAPWHIYSSNQNYELGPVPARFKFEPHGSFELLGDVVPIGDKKAYEPVFEVHVNYFEKRAEFHQRIRVLSDTLNIKGVCEYQLCNALDGMCLFRSETFEFNTQTLNE